jgi:hypothetical protein
MEPVFEDQGPDHFLEGTMKTASRSAKVTVEIEKDGKRESYTLFSIRKDQLQPHEAWSLRKHSEPKTYHLACEKAGRTTCTCPGYTHHKHCKHSEWAIAWGLTPSLEHALFVSQLDCRNGHLECTIEDLTEQLADAQARCLNLARAMEQEIHQDEEQERADGRNPYSDEPLDASPAPATNTGLHEGQRALWHRKRSVPLIVTIVKIDHRSGRAKILLPAGHHRSVTLGHLTPEKVTARISSPVPF